jgi:hypothetical protein
MAPPGSEDAHGARVGVLVENLASWISQPENQQFYSLQEAYRQWLHSRGYASIGSNYTDAVAIMLLYLSRCVVNPQERRYLISDTHEPEEHAILQVRVPEDEEDLTYWEFLTEVNFRKGYEEWRESRSEL